MTKKHSVFITRVVPGAIDLLEKYCDTEVNTEDRVLSKKELMERVKGKDAVLCLLTDNIDDDIFEAAGPQCKIFANYAVG